MTTRKVAMSIGGTVLALLVTVSAIAGYSPQRSYLTFSGPVRLPGVTLAAGTYAFETAVPGQSIVRVVDERHRQVVFMAFTERTIRPEGMPADHEIVFQESASNVPPGIDGWYPSNSSTGHRFIYSDRH